MAITVTLPVTAPTGLNAALQSGGSLAPSTQYWFVVLAFHNWDAQDAYFTPSAYSRTCFHSPLSAEGTFTTTATDLSALITWTNSEANNYYTILLTTTQGDYTNSLPYNMASNETFASKLDGSTGYLITGPATQNTSVHSCQLVGTLPGSLDKTLGILKVEFDGNSTYYIDDVYDAIVSAGFSDYVSYDGYFFIFKGWFYVDINESGTGLLYVRRKSLLFVRGGVSCKSYTFAIQFGQYADDYQKAIDGQGCNIELLGARYPFVGLRPGGLKVYACRISFNDSYDSSGDIVNTLPYIGPYNNYLGYDISEFVQNINGVLGRSITSSIKDQKWGQGNNFGNEPHIRLNVYESAYMPYVQGGSFYDCEFSDNEAYNNWTSGGQTGWYTDFYDHRDVYWTNPYPGVQAGSVQWNVAATNIPPWQTNSFIRWNQSVKLKVLDVNGDPISGVTVSALDKDGNEATWVEQDGSSDRLATGNRYNTPRTTDVNGEIDYYLFTHQANIDPDYAGPDQFTTDTLVTEYYPFTIIFTKAGYEPYQVYLETMYEPFLGIVTLSEVEDVLDGGLTNAYEVQSVRHLFLNEAIPKVGDAAGLQPSATDGYLYVALFTQSPGEVGSIAYEATYSGYARAAVPRGSAGWVELNGQIYNFGQINFPEVVANPNTVTYFAVMKEATGSDMISYSQLQEQKTFNPTDQPQFGPMALGFKIG